MFRIMSLHQAIFSSSNCHSEDPHCERKHRWPKNQLLFTVLSQSLHLFKVNKFWTFSTWGQEQHVESVTNPFIHSFNNIYFHHRREKQSRRQQMATTGIQDAVGDWQRGSPTAGFGTSLQTEASTESNNNFLENYWLLGLIFVGIPGLYWIFCTKCTDNNLSRSVIILK